MRMYIYACELVHGLKCQHRHQHRHFHCTTSVNSIDFRIFTDKGRHVYLFAKVCKQVSETLAHVHASSIPVRNKLKTHCLSIKQFRIFNSYLVRQCQFSILTYFGVGLFVLNVCRYKLSSNCSCRTLIRNTLERRTLTLENLSVHN